jgi:nicotine blue oxidoreductase
VIAAVVLAAGAATRYGRPKQREFLPAVLAALEGIETVVVQGAYELEAPAARVVDCPRWADGPGVSLRCGLAALGDDAEAAIVVLADGPGLAPAAIDRVAARWNGEPVLAASYGGVRGHPVLIARSAWGSIPDDGARALEPVLVPCDDLGYPGDVDTVEDLA